jgi:hypothetical protein
MTIHEYLMKARQDDAQRAGERDRLLLEARRARMARLEEHRAGPAAPVRRLAQLMLRRAAHGILSHRPLASHRAARSGGASSPGHPIWREVPADDGAGAVQTLLPLTPNSQPEHR